MVWGDREGGKLGIVTAGTIAYDVIEAMQAMGIDEQKACDLGISVYKVKSRVYTIVLTFFVIVFHLFLLVKLFSSRLFKHMIHL